MLAELRVENLLLIDRAELRLADGLNVLTGETGAGKTVLAHALDLLLGGRARSSPVRPGASEAYVEGAFELTGGLRRRLGERLPDDAEELVLARRVAQDGRTRAYVNGRSIAVGELRDLAGGLLTFYGQHEHRRLTLASAHLDVLDGFCGGDQAELRAAYATAHSRRREAVARLEALREAAGSRDRELDLVQFELAEIEEAAPEPCEDEELRGERDRLRSAEGLRSAALSAAEALVADSGRGAATLVAEAAARLEALSGLDARLDGFTQRLRGLGYEAEELGRELRRYEDAVESSPGRLEEVEERLAVLDRLKRKHGGTLDAVLAHADRCRDRRDELAGAEVALEEATARLEAIESELSEHGRRLSAARRYAAPRLAAAVRERLAELAMPDAGFEVRLAPREESGPAGEETVDFLIAPNPGVPAGPVREIASGGELSRIMLALMGLAAEAGSRQTDDAPPLLVFDEVDAGIGGHTARAVGARLRALATTHQVLCITHLPQVASLADRHFRIVKDLAGPTARAAVDQLEAREVEGELVRMLGAASDDAAARRHARQLLRAA